MAYSLVSLPMTGFNMIKGGVSAGVEKTGETAKEFVSGVSSSISDTLSDTYTPTKEYVTSTVKDIPGYWKSDVVDATINDLKFTGFKAKPFMTTAKAIFSPVTLFPRATWVATKSVGSAAWAATTGAPKRTWDTSGAIVGGVGSLAGNMIKGATGMVEIGAKTIDGMIDGVMGSGSSSESKK